MQPSAAPSALTDDRLKPQANGHPRLDAAAGDPIETSGADQEDTHRLSEEQRDCSADMLDVGSLEEVEEMMEGRACGEWTQAACSGCVRVCECPSANAGEQRKYACSTAGFLHHCAS
eukprot:scaffold17082_cov20-Tisochrysis_lutea.AAC.2